MFVLELHLLDGEREIWFKRSGGDKAFRERTGRWETDDYNIQAALNAHDCPEGWWVMKRLLTRGWHASWGDPIGYEDVAYFDDSVDCPRVFCAVAKIAYGESGE